jgi:hypothetical protein
MRNDCQACGSAQAHVRRSISLEYLHKNKDWRRKWEGDAVDLLVTPATKSKPRGQEGIVKMSGGNKLWSVCAVDARGPVSRDAGEQSAGATPHRRGVLLPPVRWRKAGKGNMVKYAKGVPGGCRWKWTVIKARWRTTEPEEVKLSSLRCSHWQRHDWHS